MGEEVFGEEELLLLGVFLCKGSDEAKARVLFEIADTERSEVLTKD